MLYKPSGMGLWCIQHVGCCLLGGWLAVASFQLFLLVPVVPKAYWHCLYGKPVYCMTS